MRGKFITLEGIDRSGKSTQARLLHEALRERGHNVMLVREPGGTDLGERVRALLKDDNLVITGHAEALLFAAARAELVAEVIVPALENGRNVLSDRFVDSSIAYQGAARGLGTAPIRSINDWATGGLMPDLTVLLQISPQDAATRAGVEQDRFEDEGIALQRLVADSFQELIDAHRDRIKAVDATLDEQSVLSQLLGLVEPLLSDSLQGGADSGFSGNDARD